MNGMNFAPPPGLKGNEKSQLVQIHSFLFRLTEQLNAALVQTDNAIQKAQTAVSASGKPADGSTEAEYRELKSLIIKSADAVRAEMDVVETTLRSEYQAISDEWGTFQENIDRTIIDTAESTIESYNYQAQIDGLEQFQQTSQGYIRRGIIGFDDNNLPIYGIAIGQELGNVEVEKDGTVYETIDMTRSMAIYTANKMAFYQNGVEVASFNQKTLTVTDIDVSDTVTFNKQWELSRKYGFTLRWIGGDE